MVGREDDDGFAGKTWERCAGDPPEPSGKLLQATEAAAWLCQLIEPFADGPHRGLVECPDALRGSLKSSQLTSA
jgi:hypothetical protein